MHMQSICHKNTLVLAQWSTWCDCHGADGKHINSQKSSDKISL